MSQTDFIHTDKETLSSILELAINWLPITPTQDFMEELQQLHNVCNAAIDSEPDALLCCLFINAIMEHYQPNNSATGHLYLERYEIPQIKLFDTLINRFPFVVSAHAISNRLISSYIGDSASAVVLDVGIGRGIQMAALIQQLEANRHLTDLTIIGVEPFGDTIPFAMQLIRQAADKAHFRVSLHVMQGFGENIEPALIKQMLPAAYQRLVVNGSLAIHHIPSVAQRIRFFHKISMLQPDAIVLTEPHTDHMTANWRQRTKNAWLHYGAIFNTIDHLDITGEEKNGLKMFFGREIADVVGNTDDTRFERHEPAAHWVAYGQQAGLAVDNNASIGPLPDDVISIRHSEEGLMMQRNNTDVLAIIPLVKSALQ